MKLELIPEWKSELRRLWSARIAMFWGLVGGLILVGPLVSDEAKAVVGPVPFGGLLILASISFAAARFLKQPGTDE